MDALPDPLGQLRCDAFVSAQMQAPQCLTFPKQAGHMCDSLRAHACVVKIQSDQVQVVLDEGLQTVYDVLIPGCELP